MSNQAPGKGGNFRKISSHDRVPSRRPRRVADTPRRSVWLPLMLILLIAVLGVAGLLVLRKKKSTEPVPAAVPSSGSTELTALTRAETDFSKGEALAAAWAFARETDPARRLELVRNAEEVKSRLVSYPPQALTEVPVSLDHEIQGSVGSALSISYKATFADGSARLLPIIQSAGGPVVDWDCYARHCSTPWREILSGKPVEAEVRIFLAPDHYYNFDFADESVWKCFLLRSADLEDPIRAYTRIGSEAEKSLSNPPEGVMRATLRIKLTLGQATHRQCEILELVTYGWVKE